MKTTLGAALCLLPNLLCAQARDIRLGAWEMTYSSPDGPGPMVAKECLTKPDLGEFSGGLFKGNDGDCKARKPPTLKGNTWTVSKKCKHGLHVRARYTLDSPERLRGSFVLSDAKGEGEISMKVSGRWTAANCKAGR